MNVLNKNRKKSLYRIKDIVSKLIDKELDCVVKEYPNKLDPNKRNVVLIFDPKRVYTHKKKGMIKHL